MRDLTAEEIVEERKLQAAANAGERRDFEDLFRLAGYKSYSLEPIDNRYWPDAYKDMRYCNDWYNVTTEFGVIRIGWRKRVVNIDWSATGLDLEVFFHDEEVTKGSYNIHAWGSPYGYAKTLEYLVRLNKLFECTPEGLARHREFHAEIATRKKKERDAKRIESTGMGAQIR